MRNFYKTFILFFITFILSKEAISKEDVQIREEFLTQLKTGLGKKKFFREQGFSSAEIENLKLSGFGIDCSQLRLQQVRQILTVLNIGLPGNYDPEVIAFRTLCMQGIESEIQSIGYIESLKKKEESFKKSMDTFIGEVQKVKDTIDLEEKQQRCAQALIKCKDLEEQVQAFQILKKNKEGDDKHKELQALSTTLQTYSAALDQIYKGIESDSLQNRLREWEERIANPTLTIIDLQKIQKEIDNALNNSPFYHAEPALEKLRDELTDFFYKLEERIRVRKGREEIIPVLKDFREKMEQLEEAIKQPEVNIAQIKQELQQRRSQHDGLWKKVLTVSLGDDFEGGDFEQNTKIFAQYQDQLDKIEDRLKTIELQKEAEVEIKNTAISKQELSLQEANILQKNDLLEMNIENDLNREEIGENDPQRMIQDKPQEMEMGKSQRDISAAIAMSFSDKHFHTMGGAGVGFCLGMIYILWNDKTIRSKIFGLKGTSAKRKSPTKGKEENSIHWKNILWKTFQVTGLSVLGAVIGSFVDKPNSTLKS